MAQATLFRRLVQEHDWTTIETFTIHFERAARELAERTGERRLADVLVSRRSFDRWMRGDLVRTPQRDTRRILEHLFERPATALFRTLPADDEPLPVAQSPAAPTAEPANIRKADVDPALVPHWNTLLSTLATTHNALGPLQIHAVVTREMDVIRAYRRYADGGTLTGLINVEARWAEFAGWTAENLGNTQDADYWLGRSLDLCRATGNEALEAFVLMRQAHRAVEQNDARTACGLADAAWSAAAASDRDRALSAVRRAQAHALLGDSRSCALALRTAHRLAERADETGTIDDPATIGHHCVPTYVQAHEAYCLLHLGQPARAADLLHDALAVWPAEYRQDEQLARAWLALAYAADGRPVEAAMEGSATLAQTAAGGSVRTLRSLRTLDRRLTSGTGPPAEVVQFRSVLSMSLAVARR